MQVTTDQDKCVGAGQCALTAPEVFDQRDEDGVVVLLDEHPPEHVQEAAREAADLCPAAAIRVYENTDR